MALPEPKHQILELTEFRFVGGDRKPATGHTMLRLRALSPISSFPFRFDTSEVAKVTVDEGGRTSGVYSAEEGENAVDIIFDQPLEAGDETTVTYSTEFEYTKPSAPEFRLQIGPYVLGVLDVTVVFEETAQPTGIWQTEWESQHPDSPIVHEEPVALEPFEGRPDKVAASLALGRLNNTTVGFRWEWPEPAPSPSQ